MHVAIVYVNKAVSHTYIHIAIVCFVVDCSKISVPHVIECVSE